MDEYGRLVPTAHLESLAKRLDESIKNLAAYIDRWEQNISTIDAALQTYEIMPGDEDIVDSVRVLLNWTVYAQQLITGELNNRR